jgi:cellulose synthase/poly-beta-1,6-N-acetylglucosamine synthase-like glycosyltransferase
MELSLARDRLRPDGLLPWLAFGALLILVIVPHTLFVGRVLIDEAPSLPDDLLVTGICVWYLGRPTLVIATAHRRLRTTRRLAGVGVSVIIPCHNASARIRRTVDSILAQNIRPLEIILVENKSADDTLEVLRELEARFEQVRVFSVDPPRGHYAASVAINYGIRQATHDIVLRLDDDTYLGPNAIEAGIAEMQAHDAVAVACNLRVANAGATLWTRLQSLEYLLAMELERQTQALADTVMCCSGGMSIYRREVALRAGGFVSLPREVSEDLDMTLKSHRFGRIAMSPHAIGYTYVPERLGQLLRQRFRWSISGTVSLYLHRRGLLNRSYWHGELVGFLGVPFRYAIAIRDMAAIVLPVAVPLFGPHSALKWLLAILSVRALAMTVTLVFLGPVLRCRQGLAYFFSIPIFLVFYGPLLLLTRSLGTWNGILHIVELRRKEDRLEAGGIGGAVVLPPSELVGSPRRAMVAVAADQPLP